MPSERLPDAGLAAVALAAVVVVAVSLGVGGQPLVLAAGAVCSLAAELVLQHRQEAVRQVWARTPVKAAAVGLFFAALALSVAVAPAAGLSLLAGGLVGYLALLAGPAVGESVRWLRGT